MTDSKHGKGQMPPYVTLGLAARKALPGSRAAEKDIDSSTRDGRVHLSSFTLRPIRRRDKDAWWFCRRESGRRILMPKRYGQPSVRRKRQCDETSRNEHLARVRLSSSSCGSRPMLLPGINARPSRLALPGPPWPHHHSSPGPKMRPRMLEESPWQGIGASLGTPPIRTAGLNWRSSQPLATYRLAQFSNVRCSSCDNTSGASTGSPTLPAHCTPAALSSSNQSAEAKGDSSGDRELKTGTLDVSEHRTLPAPGATISGTLHLTAAIDVPS